MILTRLYWSAVQKLSTKPPLLFVHGSYHAGVSLLLEHELPAVAAVLSPATAESALATAQLTQTIAVCTSLHHAGTTSKMIC